MAIVSGLAIAAILAIFVKPVRERFWKPIGRGIRWLFTLRLTTTKRIALWEAEYESLRNEVGYAISDNKKRTITAELVAFNRGRAEALAEVEKERGEFLVQPNWTIDKLPIGAAYGLRNTQSGVVVSDVSLSASVTAFVFEGANQWPGVFAGNVQFFGAPTKAGGTLGVTLTVRWRDARGDWKEGQAFIDREPIRAYWV